VAAWQAERGGRWSEAAGLWRSLGRHGDESRCLARIAHIADTALPGDSPSAELADGEPGDES